jgi:two-component system copper resistance phosphate regulon response regulator CusR
MSAAKAPAAREAVRVLLVEDDPDVGVMLERRLASEGLSIRRAADGEEALREAMASPPDVIVLDLMLPGMDGYKMARILRQQDGCADVPIVVVSALTHRDNRKRAMKEANAAAYLTKPFDFREMFDAVTKAVAARKPAPPRTAEEARP